VHNLLSAVCAHAVRSCCIVVTLFAFSHLPVSAQDEKKKEPPTPGPKGVEDFDFTAGDLLISRMWWSPMIQISGAPAGIARS